MNYPYATLLLILTGSTFGQIQYVIFLQSVPSIDFESCSPNQFQCSNGTCIDKGKQCDFQGDCEDLSDESNCVFEGCSSDQYQCFDGTCIGGELRCDFVPDCKDMSDETDCYNECKMSKDRPGLMYRGKRNLTISGRPCQRFDQQQPHRHVFTALGPENYCRNENSQTPGPWCYTLDPDVRWELCDVPYCREFSRKNCGFESGICDWNQPRNNAVWSIQDTWTDAEDKLLLADLSTVPSTGEVQLFSKAIGPSVHRCFGLSYYIHGTKVERFDILITHGYSNNRSLTSGRRYKRNTWERIYLSVYENTEYGILIDVKVNGNGTGSIAVDDTSLSFGICPGLNLCSTTEYQCDDSTCVDVHHFCDGISDCPDDSDELNCQMNCLLDYDTKGLLYTGKVNITRSGRQCQGWNEQTPHRHNITTLTGNYCRNPTNDTGPWCYTSDASVRWEYCSIPDCDNDCIQKDDPQGIGYFGQVNVTVSGMPCRPWEGMTTFSGDENYCRNPSGERQPWCYTTNKLVRWGYCSVPTCEIRKCDGEELACQRQYGQNRELHNPLLKDTINASVSNAGNCFKCENSSTCLAEGSVCNGVYQCPSYDDEMLCNITCPKECSCNGLILNCVINDSIISPISRNVRALCIKGDQFSLSMLFSFRLPFLFHLTISNTPISSITDSDIFAIRLQSSQLQSLNLSHNKIESISRYAFAGLSRLRELYLDNNPLVTLQSNTFDQLGSLVHLSLGNTKVQSIFYKTLDGLVSLKLISLQNNMINYIETGSLHSLATVTTVNLTGNTIRTINTPFSVKMSKLAIIDLSYNMIENITTESLQGLYYLETLDLCHNLISRIQRNSFGNLPKLLRLDLSYNLISVIEKDMFKGQVSLQYLDLQENRIDYIKRGAFNGLKSVKFLNLNHNMINRIEKRSFLGMGELRSLFLKDNPLIVYKEMFYGLCRLKTIHADTYRVCCARPASVSAKNCVAPADKISSCDYLIDVGLLSISIWLIALLTIVGNIIVIAYRCHTFSSSKIRPHDILILNLSIADFVMGIYLLIIAIVDLQYRGEYGYKDLEWRGSMGCKISGILATVSSEMSALLIFVITVDRVKALKFPFSKHRFNNSGAVFVVIFLWLFSLTIALIPLVYNSYYSLSSVCISLPLSTELNEGWQYSVGMFIVFNLVLFIGIVGGQALIYLEVRQSGRRVQKSTNNEAAVARTILTLALTDALCWIPIAVLGLLTQSGIEISANAYAWVIVLVLPVNSALNPFLYTLSAIVVKQMKKETSTIPMTARRPAGRNHSNTSETLNHCCRMKIVY